MTIETKHLIDFGDIEALEYECKKCKTGFTFPISESKRLIQCPVCNSDWLLPQSREEEAIRLLVGALRDATQSLNARPFTMRLKISSTPLVPVGPKP